MVRGRSEFSGRYSPNVDPLVIVPGPRGDRFIELSRSKQGRVFRKQILHYGDLIYPNAPGGKVKIDETFADTLIANFAAGVADIVQVPKVDGNNHHTEDPDRNVGEVISIEKDARGVYVNLDVRTDDADKIGKTLLGASAMLHLNYTDTHTGKRVGPTLLHTAITNRPYVTNLDGFEEIIAASQTGSDIDTQVLVLSPADNEENLMDKDELIAKLKSEHGIDVEDLLASQEKSVALSNKIQEQLVGTGLLTLSNSDEPIEADALIGAVAEAGNKIVELSGKVDTLMEAAAKEAAEARVDKLIRTGFVLPKKREANIRLLLSNPEDFEALLPEEPLVKLSAESGVDPVDETPATALQAEVDRIAQQHLQTSASA